MSMPLPCPAFVEDVVTRLRRHCAQEAARNAAVFIEDDPDDNAAEEHPDVPVPDTEPLAPLDLLVARHRAREARAERAARSDAAAAEIEAGATPPEAPARTAPPVQVPATDLALALRLAATYGSPAGLSAPLRPGALTCLTGISAKEAKAIARLLPICILPTKVRIVDRFCASSPAGRSLLILHPESDEEPISEAVRTRFLRALTDALASGTTPILLLLPTALRLPPDLAAHLPPAHPLAPLGRDLMLAHLGASYAPLTPDDHVAIAAALPDDRALAGLSDIALALALREPDARAAAERLAALVAPHRQTDLPRLEEIGGSGAATRAARRLVADLALWRAGTVAWSELSHSMLLYGPPGTGKTWLARAMGQSAGIGFVSASFAQWQASGHLGQMLAAMRASFAEARRLRPALLFIDEIDAVGTRSDPELHNRNYRHQVINGFLEEMDTIARDEGVIVVGACNHPERIDPAVLRAGRFDLTLEVPLPDAGMLHGILERHLDFPEPELRALAAAAVGLSAADLDAAIRLTRTDARAAGRTVGSADLQARLAVLQPRCPEHDRRVALHECGHAIVAAALGRGRVTRLLMRRGGGETTRAAIPTGTLLDDIEREIAVLLAGRAAEHLILGAVSAGSGGGPDSDLARATRMALSIDTTSGLGAEGPVWLDTPDALLLREPATHARVRARIEAAEARARTILARNRALLEGMAEALWTARELDQEAAALWLARVLDDTASTTDGANLKEEVSDKLESCSQFPDRSCNQAASWPTVATRPRRC